MSGIKQTQFVCTQYPSNQCYFMGQLMTVNEMCFLDARTIFFNVLVISISYCLLTSFTYSSFCCQHWGVLLFSVSYWILMGFFFPILPSLNIFQSCGDTSKSFRIFPWTNVIVQFFSFDLWRHCVKVNFVSGRTSSLYQAGLLVFFTLVIIHVPGAQMCSFLGAKIVLRSQTISYNHDNLFKCKTPNANQGFVKHCFCTEISWTSTTRPICCG